MKHARRPSWWVTHRDEVLGAAGGVVFVLTVTVALLAFADAAG